MKDRTCSLPKHMRERAASKTLELGVSELREAARDEMAFDVSSEVSSEEDVGFVVVEAADRRRLVAS